MQYLVVIEQGPVTFGAYVPDLPGCMAVGETRQETVDLIKEAMEFHLDAMTKDGQPVPAPHFTVELVEIENG